MDKWWRHGRGRSHEFLLADEEIQALLSESLPPEFGPYTLIGTYLEKEGKVHKYRFIETDINQYFTLRKKGIWAVFIKSYRITGQLKDCDDNNIHKLFPINGLPIVQRHDKIFDGGKKNGRIAIVNKIMNSETGEIVSHSDYEKIYNVLVKAFKRAEKAKSIKKGA